MTLRERWKFSQKKKMKSSREKKDGADQYAREVLFNLEEKLSSQLNQIRLGIDSLTEVKEMKIS